MDTRFMNSEKSKASKSHRSLLYLTDKRCLKRSDIYVVILYLRCSFESKFEYLKMALSDVLIRKLRLFDIIDFSWFHILLTIKQS